MRGAVVALAGIVLATGCAGLPPTTRTAVIHEIKLETHLAPAELTVHVGDEVRWANHRTLSALIDIPGLKSEMLSCQRGFTNLFGSPRELTELDANESASLCFDRPIVISYNARMRSAAPGGMQIEAGTIRVVAPAQ